MREKIRSAMFAGQFYPSSTKELKRKIDNFLKAVPDNKIHGDIKALITPHAGYDFSGLVMAYAFKQLAGKKINTVVIIGNSHKAYFDGMAIDDNEVWQTALGKVIVDKELADKLIRADKAIKYNGLVHKQDHVLEVEIPFLQVVLNSNFKIAPILFGNKYDWSYKKLAQALKNNLKDNDLVVISTDMSHYPEYGDANKIDQGSLEKIKSGKVEDLEKYIKKIEKSNYDNEQTTLCGIDAVKTGLELCNLAEWNKIQILKYANSGDAPLIGDKKNVVGYGAIAFIQNKNAKIKTQNKLNSEQKKKLIDIVRQTVGNYVLTGKVLDFNIDDEMLNKKQGAFVTLYRRGQLRGCIGQIIPANKPLWQTARDMAIAASTEDPRFNPITEAELFEISYEISVLSELEKISDWKKIKLGKHGVIVRQGCDSGVFLPQVADETGWGKEEFLKHLCQDKAGLPADCYKNKNTELTVFTAQIFGEKR